MLCSLVSVVFFFKQKTAYEMRISDWSSDVCSSDLTAFERTDTCASAEVRCDDASAGEVWPAPFELGSDELIGQAMKSEALHAGVKQSAGNGEAAHEIRLCAMEGGVEARDLCDVGP